MLIRNGVLLGTWEVVLGSSAVASLRRVSSVDTNARKCKVR